MKEKSYKKIDEQADIAETLAAWKICTEKNTEKKEEKPVRKPVGRYLHLKNWDWSNTRTRRDDATERFSSDVTRL